MNEEWYNDQIRQAKDRDWVSMPRHYLHTFHKREIYLSGQITKHG